jgi:hypothetical protein
MFARARWLAAVAALASLALHSRPAAATDCTPSSGISSCFDPDNLWPSAGATRFLSIAPAEATPPSELAFVSALTFISRPVQLNVPSPDPEGRDVRVVSDALNLTLAFAYGATKELELGLALPTTLHQSGAGAEGITSQSSQPLSRSAVHDPRLGVGLALPVPRAAVLAAGLAAKARFELGVPLGDEELYAGDSGFFAAPSLAISFRRSTVYGGAELGARIRKSVPFATARIGSELTSSVGLGVDILNRELLSFGVEAYVLPVLVAQPGRDTPGDRVHDGLLVPAEWLASLRSAPFSDKRFSLQLGGGTGIALSSEIHDGPDGSSTTHFAGVTTPRWRGIFSVRYTPSAGKI